MAPSTPVCAIAPESASSENKASKQTTCLIRSPCRISNLLRHVALVGPPPSQCSNRSILVQPLSKLKAVRGSRPSHWTKALADTSVAVILQQINGLVY